MNPSGKEKLENGKRANLRRNTAVFRFPFSLFLFMCLCVHLWPTALPAQEQELVANLASGRVLMCVTKDGIFVSVVENKVEPESHPPIVMPLSGRRIAVLLGATEWLDPSSGEKPLLLAEELPKLIGAVATGPRLQQEQGNDIEKLGIALLEPLRSITRKLHRKIDLAEDEPLLELLLVGYAEDYGPEVWHLKYRITQEALRGEYWQTRILRPSYNQLYPPEKGQPRTLMEVEYPPQREPAPTTLALIQQGDPRLAALGQSSPPAAKALDSLLRGESHKAPMAEVSELLRAALNATTPPEQSQIIAVISERNGFQWVLAPPQPVHKAEEGTPGARPAGAPSLKKKPPQ